MAPEREGTRLRGGPDGMRAVRRRQTALAPEKGRGPLAGRTGCTCGQHALPRSEVKIAGGIVVGNILDHLMNERHLAFRQSAFLDILSENGTEYSAEIFMTRI